SRGRDEEGEDSPAQVDHQKGATTVPAVDQRAAGKLKRKRGDDLEDCELGHQGGSMRELEQEEGDRDIANGVAQVGHALRDQEDREAAVAAQQSEQRRAS